MNRNQATQLQRDWLEACEQVGIPAITTDTSARIMAIMYVHGGGEEDADSRLGAQADARPLRHEAARVEKIMYNYI